MYIIFKRNIECSFIIKLNIYIRIISDGEKSSRRNCN